MESLKKKYLFLTSSSTLLYSLLGLILIGFGVLAYKTNIIFSSGDKVEVLNSTNAGPEVSQDIVVEISGAVEKEGVYQMKMGDRIDDLLIISGGLSENADRDWVTKSINRASKLIDGQKIYIYHLREMSAKDTSGIKLDQGILGDKTINNSNLININNASQSKLEELVGIGPVYATNIIEHRPYSNLEELVSKGAISQKVLDKIKNEISIY